MPFHGVSLWWRDVAYSKGRDFIVGEVCSVYPDEGAGVCHLIKKLLLPLLLRLMAAGLAAGMH